MDDKKQNSRDEISDIVTYLEINKELRHEIWCAIQNKMEIKIGDERNERLKEPDYYKTLFKLIVKPRFCRLRNYCY